MVAQRNEGGKREERMGWHLGWRHNAPKKANPGAGPSRLGVNKMPALQKDLSWRRESAEWEILTLVQGRASNEAVGWGGNGR